MCPHYRGHILIFLPIAQQQANCQQQASCQQQEPACQQPTTVFIESERATCKPKQRIRNPFLVFN